MSGEIIVQIEELEDALNKVELLTAEADRYYTEVVEQRRHITRVEKLLYVQESENDHLKVDLEYEELKQTHLRETIECQVKEIASLSSELKNLKALAELKQSSLRDTIERQAQEIKKLSSELENFKSLTSDCSKAILDNTFNIVSPF